MANEVFISYSRKDYDTVRKIKQMIDRETGIDCWMDLDGIESDQQFVRVIINAIKEHDTILFMKSKESMNSRFALHELAFAEREKKRIVIIDLDGVEMTDEFYFNYHDKDIISWSDARQRDKLIRNLKNWYAQEEGQEIGAAERLYLFEKGGQYLDDKQYDKAFQSFLMAAEQGDAISQNNVGSMYARGMGVDQSYDEAMKWFRKAAEQGNDDAQFSIGNMYLFGHGVRKNYVEAGKWYSLSAAQGNANAQLAMGLIYELGKGVEQNYDEAIRWYGMAAAQGLQEANESIARVTRRKSQPL